MMWYWGSGAHWWAWTIGFVLMVAFWGVIVWAIWYLVTSTTRRSDHNGSGGDAKHILDERLARGEIDADEYSKLRNLMQAPEGCPGDRTHSSSAGGSG